MVDYVNYYYRVTSHKVNSDESNGGKDLAAWKHRSGTARGRGACGSVR